MESEEKDAEISILKSELEKLEATTSIPHKIHMLLVMSDAYVHHMLILPIWTAHTKHVSSPYCIPTSKPYTICENPNYVT